MNLSAPVSSIMSRDLHVVLANDYASLIKHFFDKKSISHILVMQQGNVVGVISEQDFRHFLMTLNRRFNNRSLAKSMLNIYIAEDIMNSEFSIIEPTDTIGTALELLNDNIFNALPVVDKGRFIGVITANHILKTLTKGKIVQMIPSQIA